jgi:hypothetical protein
VYASSPTRKRNGLSPSHFWKWTSMSQQYYLTLPGHILLLTSVNELDHLAKHFPRCLWFQQKGYVTISGWAGVIFARAKSLSINHGTSHAKAILNGTVLWFFWWCGVIFNKKEKRIVMKDIALEQYLRLWHKI